MRANMITAKPLFTPAFFASVFASVKSLVWPSLLILSALVWVAPVLGQLDPDNRPPTQDLLPETTVSFVQVDNFRDLIDKMRETAMWQMLDEEAIASLSDGLVEEARSAYEEVKGADGPELDDLAELPAGEMTFAVIAPRRKSLEYMLILELNDKTEAIDRVLDSGRAIVESQADQEITSEESEDGIEYESFNLDSRRIKFFRRGGFLVGSTSESELDDFVDRWAGREVEKVRPLSSNRKFITIMNRCLGSKDLRPEARFYVDPVAFAKSYYRGNVSAQVAINFLPSLGLDGLLGIGGSMLLSEDDFESVVHGHVLLADPRTGIFEMTALKPTNYEPEPWLPDNTVSYMTTSWDIDQMLSEYTKMIEAFQGEGVVDEWIEKNINEETGLDLKQDVLAHLTGRVTYCQWMEEPIKLNSQNNIFAMEIENLEEFESSLEAIIDRLNRGEEKKEELEKEKEKEEEEAEESEETETNKPRAPKSDEENASRYARDAKAKQRRAKAAEAADTEPRLEVTDYKGIRIWSQPLGRIERRIEERNKRFVKRRKKAAKEDGEPQKTMTELTYDDLLVPQPSFALIGNYFVYSPQSKTFIEHAIDTDQGDGVPLFDDARFQTISDKVTKLLKSDLPCAMMYSNPEEQIRMMLELYKSDSTQTIISRMGESNQYLARVQSRLEENPLPDFEDIKKYIKPTGGYAQSDQTGYHFMMFVLRGESEEQ